MTTRHTGADQWVGDIHVVVTGSGRPLLLIHGNSGSHRFFDRNLPALARTHRVLAMDCRGQGRSARGDGPLTISRMADDAADVVRALVGGACDVVGFSDGANVAMLLAVRHPELVGGLVLNSGNIAVKGMTWSLRWKLRLVDRYLAFRTRWLPRVLAHQELIRLLLDQPGITPTDLERIASPTLVLAGSRDIIRLRHTQLIAALIPGARLHIVPGARHTAMRDLPDVVTPIVEAFLDGHAEGPA